ncbi:heterocyst frequency control protein PatD [Oscillatoria sp. FACHB-1406]|uniref:heterocyst frequency control protein PatD n=1 Tax=Oscillatoria sp. FACHB-1406 TaxID=2692846 RepID=UPI0016884719|nr:heterocyst frequency control protein PatD [Oscillatoria sp. FACHB-1406]MBD2580022.1 heterocyst frequency control protein PatD [Oscillatoria sp. FACHB-1406]
MLPALHCQHYEEWSNALERLKDRVERGVNLSEEFTAVQQLYQEKIVTLSHQGIDFASAPRYQSLQTEIHRTLRLLQADLLFLKAARKSDTVLERQRTCLQHVKQLIGYCSAILNLGA